MRIKTLFLSGLAAVALVSLTGCAGVYSPPAHSPPAQWKSAPDMATVENKQFTAHLKPVCGSYNGGCEAFVLSIVSKTDKNIEVNWNKTLYISGGQTSGGFMFEGIVYKDRNNQKPPDVVFGNGTLTKTIWPNNLVNYVSGQYGGWVHVTMPQGDNGAYVTLSIDGKEISERLFVRLSVSQVQ
jgi:predicted small lipoprotein YifL